MKLQLYKIACVHFLNDTIKMKRPEKCCQMLCLLGDGHLEKVFYTNERKFLPLNHVITAKITVTFLRRASEDDGSKNQQPKLVMVSA